MDIVILVIMLSVAVVLVAGVALMARGGDINKKYSNKLMTARIFLQASALIAVAIAFFLSKN